MANVMMFVDPDPEGVSAFRIIDRKLVLPRVPCLGEVVLLGEDESGLAAHYEVVLVCYTPTDSDIDADVYGHRVYLPALIKAAAKPGASGPWRSNSRPAPFKGPASR